MNKNITKPIHHVFWIIVFLLFIAFSGCTSKDHSLPKLHSKIEARDIEAHIKNMHPSKLLPRGTGSPQEAMDARYMTRIFHHLGLSPMGDDSTFYQEYDITTGVKLKKNANVIKISDEKYSTRFSKILPWPNSGSGKVEGVLAWAGYGFHNPTETYNDYDHLDVKGKVVLIVRNYPNHPDSGNLYNHLARKINLAQKKGAIAVLVASGHQSESNTHFFSLDQYDPSLSKFDIPVMQISNRIARHLLADANLNFEKLLTHIDQKEEPDSRSTSLRVQVDVGLKNVRHLTRNIVAILKGKKYQQRYIVITAPYNYASRWSDQSNTGSVISDHAPVNAAGLLELAQYFSAHKTSNNLLFVALSGNNKGQQGFDTFWNNLPIYPVQISAMINLQDIYRTYNYSLHITGIHSAKGWKRILMQANTDDIPLHLIAKDPVRMDTLGIKVPVLKITSRDSQNPDQSNKWRGTVETLQYIARVIKQVDGGREDSLNFSKNTLLQPGYFHMPKITLGIMPDNYFQGKGVMIRYVSKGKPAAKAGIKVGDIIKAVNGNKIDDLRDYIIALNKLHKGEYATVTIDRKGKKIKLKIHF